jgi:DNA-directed RNA polymerase omega subunit
VPDKIEGAANKYALVVAAAKRTRQLVNGAPPFLQSSSANSLTIALEELARGAIIAVQAPEPEPHESAEAEPEALHALSGVASAARRLPADADDMGGGVEDLLEELEADADAEEPEDLEAVLARSLMGAHEEEGETSDEAEDLADHIGADTDLDGEGADSDKLDAESDEDSP